MTKLLRNLPRWEKQDIFTQIKSEMLLNEMDLATIKINNFQISDDLDFGGDELYELYESEFTLDFEDSLEEFENQIIENEVLVKEYKTMKTLVNACIRRNSKDEYMTYNLLSRV